MSMTYRQKLAVAEAARKRAQNNPNGAYFERALSAPEPVQEEPHEMTPMDIDAIPLDQWGQARKALGVRSDDGLFGEVKPALRVNVNSSGFPDATPVTMPVQVSDVAGADAPAYRAFKSSQQI